MPNAFSKSEIVNIETRLMASAVEAFNGSDIMARLAERLNVSSQQSELGNDTQWIPQPYISRTVSGRTLTTANIQDLTELSVPVISNNNENVFRKLNGWQLRDPRQLQKIGESAGQGLSAFVNRACATAVATWGSLYVSSTGAATGYDDVATAETRMMREDINMDTQRYYVANAKDYRGLAANMAGRGTPNDVVMDAYRRSSLGDIAGFDTYRTGFTPTQAGSTVATTTTTASYSYVPVSTQTNAINGGQSNVDNRVSGAIPVTLLTNLAVGDFITFSGTNAVSMVNKNDLGELRVFRIMSKSAPTGAGTITVSPPPINVGGSNQSEKEYGNVANAIPNGATITKVNYDTQPTNLFWSKDALVIYPTLPTPGAIPGLEVMRERTDSGIEIVMARQGDILDLGCSYRWAISFGSTVLQPQMAGVQLFSQTP